MPPRPIWQGHLKLSLVTCPVALYTATNASGNVRFNLINPKTSNRIRMQTIDPDTGPVERSALVKGYEVSKGEYVLLSEDEIRAVKLESTKTIDIERFVPAADIDRLYWDDPYFLTPEGKLGEEAFAVIREAMRRSGQIALGRIVMSTRERMLALEPRDRGIVAYTLRAEDEVRRPDDLFAGIGKARPDPEMIQIAARIIEQKKGPFDPGLFVDRYEEALKGLIADKLKGRKVRAVAPPDDTNVVDLMAALRASLDGKPARRPAARSAAAKPRTRKTGRSAA
ncbi:Ku protein [Phenylobacterium sp.]|uniref:non-homologous end joining protein Ku n=1 Tax=Phenylobacterium sp. TaxID=1871053 RepID=UPI00301D0B05